MQYFFYNHNNPDAIIILNRNTVLEKDISNDLKSFNTNNDINSFGSFQLTLSNKDMKHVDRYGYCDVKKMSSIEIFVKSNWTKANTSNGPSGDFIITEQNDTINKIVSKVYSTDITRTEREYYVNAIIVTNFNEKNLTADEIIDSGIKILLPSVISSYKRIFLGVVTTVNFGVNPGGEMILSLTGESLGYWLKSSTVNINPAVNEIGLITSNQLYVLANKYAQSTAYNIFKDLLKFTSNDSLAITDYSFDVSDSREEINLIGSQETSVESINITNGLGQPVKDFNDDKMEIPFDKGLTISEQKEKISSYSNNIYIGLSIMGNAPTQEQRNENSSIDNWQKLSKNYKDEYSGYVKILNTQAKQYNISQRINTSPSDNNFYTQIYELENLLDEKENTVISKAGNINSKEKNIVNSNISQRKKINKRIEAIKVNIEDNPAAKNQFDLLKKVENDWDIKLNKIQKFGANTVLQQYNIIEHWKQIFSQMRLEMINSSFLENIYPLKMKDGSPSTLDGEYQSKEQIARTVANNIFFEFYMDTNTNFVLKPPFINMGIEDDNSQYIIEEESLISFDYNDTVDGMITRIGVTGDYRYPVTLEKEQTYNLHTDFNLLNTYGLHHQELQNLLFCRTPLDCRDFGVAYMAKNNQELLSATVTISGRPEIRLGVCTYIKPLDMIYYIKGISHSFEAGNSFTTTLTLVAGRRIVTGYKIQSTVKTITQQYIKGIRIDVTDVDKNLSGNQIEHYVLANSTNLTYASENQINESLNSGTKLNLNNDLEKAAQYGAKVQIIKNSYIITSHPNPGYIGLIVDIGNPIISDINKNTYNYINKIVNTKNPSFSSSLKATWDNIKANFGQDVKPFEIIQEQFNLYCKDSAIKSDGSNFTRINLDEFFTIFLDYINLSIDTTNVNDENATNKDWESYKNYASAAQLFNQMINDIDSTGSYSCFTDSNGREYPTTLNYGRQIKKDALDNKIAIATKELSTYGEASIMTDQEVEDIIVGAQKLADTATGKNRTTGKINTTKSKK